ncbi:universal stress protein [uncultured Nocardioides sp.]|uniref:universal stress protein n=1 Tax=uncultured Nocardioides sp. TaxID=198441 RepID=UPI0026382AB2|nr:universal stress protein [uncultured Nocardioides sp.]
MIVVAYTPDVYGEAALAHAVTEAGIRRLGVVVVNATRGDAFVDERFASGERLAELDAALGEQGLTHEVRQPVGVEPSEAVIDVVKEVGGTLVVVGIRHRSPVGKVLMGSVAQRILLDAPCPVLAVKPAG